MWRCCGNELFSADDKFDSGTGWPNCTQSIKDENVEKKLDLSHGMMIRKEVKCTKGSVCLSRNNQELYFYCITLEYRRFFSGNAATD